MSKSQRKLKNIIIDPGFQWKFTFWITSTGLILVFLFAYIYYRYTSQNYMVFVEFAEMTPEASDQLHAELKEILFFVVGYSVLFIALVSGIGLFLSHRIAGPLHKMKLTFKEIAESGDISTRLKFRPKDEFHPLADAFNEMMDSIEKK